MQGGSGLSLEEIVRFDWQVALGEHTLTLRELETLARLKVPLVRVRGRWVSVDAEKLRAGLEFLRRATPRRTPTAAEVLALAGRHPDDWAGDEDVPLPVTAVHAQGWIGDLLEGRAERAITPIAAPPGFRAQLRPYQERGLSWLAFLAELRLGALLADDMGLGKTVQTLALLLNDAAKGPSQPNWATASFSSEISRALMESEILRLALSTLVTRASTLSPLPKRSGR